MISRPIRFCIALAAGVAALVFYLSWWSGFERYVSPWLDILLALTLVFLGAQFLGSWYLYWMAPMRARSPKVSPALTVDVFVTSCGEPLTMVDRALRAALALEGEHRTYLLDDAADPACAYLCERLGAQYLTRCVRVGAKAGNVNAALRRTNGDVIVIFDIDHIPQPNFLTRALHHFADPQVGFVQVMLTFSNQGDSLIARAAAETSLDFYNPTSLGMDAMHTATMMGSNALIRRTALEGIGGYQPGLAEDLATSLALHAAGWRSAYVAEPLAPGLAPASLLAWYTQQLKWARGVFEILLTSFPRVFARLDWGQRLAYVVRTTKYWIGLAVLLHLAISGTALLLGAGPTRSLVDSYLLHLLPLVLADLWIRREALRLWRHSSVLAIVPLRALALIYFSWPVYTLAWMMAILRLPLGFRLTPKTTPGRLKLVLLSPQIVTSVVLLFALIRNLIDGQALATPLLFGFVAAQMGLQLWLIGSWVAWQITHWYRELASDASVWKSISGF